MTALRQHEHEQIAQTGIIVDNENTGFHYFSCFSGGRDYCRCRAKPRLGFVHGEKRRGYARREPRGAAKEVSILAGGKGLGRKAPKARTMVWSRGPRLETFEMR